MVKGGIKLFKDSEGYLSCDSPIDTYTEGHNRESKKRNKMKRKQIEGDDLDECGKLEMGTSDFVYYFIMYERRLTNRRVSAGKLVSAKVKLPQPN